MSARKFLDLALFDRDEAASRVKVAERKSTVALNPSSKDRSREVVDGFNYPQSADGHFRRGGA